MDEASGSSLQQHRGINRVVSWLVSFPRLEIAALLVVSGMYAYNAIRVDLPLGYAGLYSLMTQEIIEQPFPLPTTVPYYGPGGIPFAFPPVALYVAAFFVGALRIPLFTYLRWMPPVATVAALVALYALFRLISGDRLKALLGTIVVACAETTHAYHATASGMVRSVALLFGILAAVFAFRAFGQGRRWIGLSVPAGIFVGLTIMTHLAYAAFVVLGIALMTVLDPRGRPRRRHFEVLGIIAAVAAVCSALWWVPILSRYGIQILLNAGGTHGTMGSFPRSLRGILGTLRGILRWYANLGQSWWPMSLAGLALVGFAYAIGRGRWLLPVWILVVLLFMGQTDRFEILLCGLLIAEVLVDASRGIVPADRWKPLADTASFPGLLFLGLVMLPIVGLGFRGIQWSEWALSPGLLETAQWVRENTPEDVVYVYLGNEHDVAEWLPFLTRRTPGFAPWGAEWTGNYGTQLRLTDEMAACVSAQRFQCVKDFLASLGQEVELLVLPSEHIQMENEILSDPGWQQVFRNDEYVVFRETG